jgi:hypothetical protein
MTMTTTPPKKQKTRKVMVAIRHSFSVGAHEWHKGEVVPLNDFPEVYPGMLSDRLAGGSAELVLGPED